MTDTATRIRALLKPGENLELQQSFRRHEPRGAIWFADVWYLPSRTHVVGADSMVDQEDAAGALLEKLEARRVRNN